MGNVENLRFKLRFALLGCIFWHRMFEKVTSQFANSATIEVGVVGRGQKELLHVVENSHSGINFTCHYRF